MVFKLVNLLGDSKVETSIVVLIWKPTEEETSLNGLAIKSYPFELKSIHSLASKSFDRQVGA